MLSFLKKEAALEEWKPDIQDWKVVDKEKAEFAFAQVQSHLKGTVETLDMLSHKAYIFLSILFAAISGSILIIANESSSFLFQPTWKLYTPYWIVICGCTIAMVFAICAIVPRATHGQGNTPQNLMTEETMKYETHLIICREILNYHERISDNYQSIDSKADFLQASLFAGIITLAVAASSLIFI